MIGVVCSTIDPVQERHFQCECIPEELESADADAESVSALSADATPTACGPAKDSPYGAVMTCVFCEIVAGTAPAIRVYEDDDFLGLLEIRPFTRGYTLVFPKAHSVNLTDTPPETLARMMAVGQRIARATRSSGLAATGNNVAINDGKSAMQPVFHIHLHVIPRRDGDRVSFVKGMLLRRDPDREATGRIPRDALAGMP